MYMIAEVSQYVAVASFAEAWIEIKYEFIHCVLYPVASFAEAWIEIKSFPVNLKAGTKVASFAEAWIEICFEILKQIVSDSRLLRGGVD